MPSSPILQAEAFFGRGVGRRWLWASVRRSKYGVVSSNACWNTNQSTTLGKRTQPVTIERRLSMRAILAGFALTTFFVTPTLADYYIVQEPTTKRCRIVEERPAPGVGVVIGGIGFGVRTEAETRMRTECRETSGSDVIIEERERRPAR